MHGYTYPLVIPSPTGVKPTVVNPVFHLDFPAGAIGATNFKEKTCEKRGESRKDIEARDKEIERGGREREGGRREIEKEGRESI